MVSKLFVEPLKLTWLVVAGLGTTKVQNNISVPGEAFLKSISVKKLDKPHAEDSADAACECLGSAEDRPGTSSPSSQGGRAALARNITVMEDDLSADDHTVAKAWTPELLTKIGETQAGRTGLSLAGTSCASDSRDLKPTEQCQVRFCGAERPQRTDYS